MAVVVDGDRDGEPVLVEGLRAKVPLSGGSPDREGKGAIPDEPKSFSAKLGEVEDVLKLFNFFF